MRKLFGVIALCGASSMAMAVSVEDIAMPKTYNNMFISDTANIIDEVQEKQLDDALNTHFEETGNQIAVVTTVDTKGSGSPKQFATKLFNTWGLGDADKDNGLLILLSISDRRIEFETGYGLEGVLPDVIQYRLQQEIMVPYFKKGDYEQGLLRGTYATLNKINEGMNNEVALAEADLKRAAAEIQLMTAPANTLGTAVSDNADNSDTPLFFKFLMGIGLFISSGAGLVYLFRLFSGEPKKAENKSFAYTSPIEPDRDVGKKYCGLCHKPTHQTPVIGSDFKKIHFSPYHRKLAYFNVGRINLLMCNDCSYINTDVNVEKNLTECTMCGEKSRYQFLKHTMLFKDYMNIYVDRINRTKNLNDTTFKSVAKDWQKKAEAALYLTHCFNCFDIKDRSLQLSVPNIPPKPIPKPIPVPVSTKRRDDDDDDYSGGYRSSSSSSSYGSSSSSSSSSSGSSWGGSSSGGFGGGDSGGGGAGSSW